MRTLQTLFKRCRKQIGNVSTGMRPVLNNFRNTVSTKAQSSTGWHPTSREISAAGSSTTAAPINSIASSGSTKDDSDNTGANKFGLKFLGALILSGIVSCICQEISWYRKEREAKQAIDELEANFQVIEMKHAIGEISCLDEQAGKYYKAGQYRLAMRDLKAAVKLCNKLSAEWNKNQIKQLLTERIDKYLRNGFVGDEWDDCDEDTTPGLRNGISVDDYILHCQAVLEKHIAIVEATSRKQ